MFQELTQDNLQEVVNSNQKVIVQYSAGWCGNCRMIKPKFKRFAEETEGVEFVIVDAEKFPQSRQLANVNNLPTFAAFEGGEFKNQIQTNKADVLKNFIDEVSQ
jgi:thiol-disulfide isomerase/thioredoxin